MKDLGRDPELLRGFMLALHGMTLALKVGNLMSEEWYWRAVRHLFGTLQAFAQESYQIRMAIPPLPADQSMPEKFQAAWNEQIILDREDAQRLLAALDLPLEPGN